MVTCECGKCMVGHFNHAERRYRCTAGKWHPEIHCERTIRADNLESAVWEQIKGILANPELVKAQIEQRHGNTRGAGELEAQIKTIDARLKALAQGEAAIARQLRQGLLSEDVAARELRQGQQDRAALERERDTLKGQLEGIKQWAYLDIDTLCQTALENLEAPTPEIQRLALQAFGTKVTVGHKEIRVSIALPLEQGIASSLRSSQ